MSVPSFAPRGGDAEPGGARRPRLLFLCQTLPYPPDSGVAIRTYNVLRLLAERFDVTTLCFYRWRGGAMETSLATSVAALERFGEIHAFPIPQEHSQPRLLWDHARSLLTGRVYTHYVHASADFEARLREILSNRPPNLVHVDSLDLVRYLPMLSRWPVICVHHNVESALLARRAKIEPTRLKRAYVGHQARLMARTESLWCPRVQLNVCVSEEDAATLRARIPAGRYCVVPNGVDVESFVPGASDGHGLIFVGGTSWFPNLDALEYFATDILPLIRRRVPDVRVVWAGRATQEEMRRYRADHDIEMTGYVTDIRPYVHNAACYVVPLRVGGGTRLKILDGWAMGMPMVSTSVGAEGLATRDGENILLRDDPQGFADAVVTVLLDAALRAHLGRGARRTVEEIYDWDVIGRGMLAAYSALLA